MINKSEMELIDWYETKNNIPPYILESAQEGFIDNPELWFDFLDDRNETVHAYNKAITNSVFQDLHLFDAEVGKLIQTLKQLK